MTEAENSEQTLSLLSVVIPAHNEEGCICSTVEHLHVELRIHKVPHEIIVVDDCSTDNTRDVLRELKVNAAFHRIGSMFCLFFTPGPVVDLASAQRSDLKMFTRFFQSCLQRGIYFAPSQFETGFISTAHTPEDIDRTAAVVREVLAGL